MATRTALVTDSTSNIPPEIAAARRLYVAPLYVIWGDQSLKDGVDITNEGLLRRMRALDSRAALPKTSQVSPQDFVTLFEQAREAENADEVVCAVISGRLSGTYASAMQARDQVKFPVHVVDTLQTSWGLGFSVLAGAVARDQGASSAEIAEVIQTVSSRVRLVFTVDDLDYLYRGGRIGNASRLLGTALNIKPILELRDGVVNAADKVRTRKRAVQQVLSIIENYVGNNTVVRLAVIHGDVEDEARELLAQALEKLRPQEHYLSFVTAVLGAHVGPGALGVIVEWAG